ncbi:MAG: aminoacyl--tRNA ligase-related protein [Anaerolineae bacterium]
MKRSKRSARRRYASPIGLSNVTVVVDDAVTSSPNLVAGANEAGYHLLNTNVGRDYTPTLITDLAAAGDGDACINCGQPLYTSRGVEVGNIFKLGTRYSAAINATFLAADGTEKPIVMGSYGIGSGRLLACVAEEHHDDKGLIWPITVAPYQVHLVALGEFEVADRIYAALKAAGIEVLYDDRSESRRQICGRGLDRLAYSVDRREQSPEEWRHRMKRRDQAEKPSCLRSI